MLRLFADLVCPFSALLVPEVEALRTAVEVLPLELHPAPEPVPDPRGPDELLIWREQVAPLARAYGTELHPAVHRSRSTLALSAGLWADEVGVGSRWRDACSKAFFVRGRDLACEDVLREVAVACGLDPDDAVDAAWDPLLLARLREVRQQAEAIGVQGVPALTVDDEPVLLGAPAAGTITAAMVGWDGTAAQLRARLPAGS